MIALLLPPVPSAAMAGISMSSWAAETYPWSVMLNAPVLSNELVPITQYAAPLWISEPGFGPDAKIWLTSVTVAAHNWPWPCETWVMLSALGLIPPSGQG